MKAIKNFGWAILLMVTLLLTKTLPAQNFIEIPDVQHYQLITDTVGNGPSLTTGDEFGRSVAVIGDLDNDGVDDIVVGAPNDDTDGGGRGAVYVCFMKANGRVKSRAKINSGTSNFVNLADDDGFGISVAGIGDLNNDGDEDIAVGASGHDIGVTGEAGAVYIIFLDASGGVVDYALLTTGAAGFSVTLSGNDNLGISVANLGDINGDGTNDIIAGAKGYDSNNGGAIVFRLKTDGTIKGITDISNGVHFGDTLVSGDNFGYSVAGFGDVNNDGHPDAIVGADGDDDGYSNAGALWVLYLDSSGVATDEKKISNPFVSTHYFPASVSVSFGQTVGITDINEDGLTDILAGVKTFNGSKGGFYFMVLDDEQNVQAIRTTGFNYSWGYGGPATAPQFGISLCEINSGATDYHKQYAVGANFHANGASAQEGSVYVVTMDSLTFDFPAGTVLGYSSVTDFSGDFTGTLADSDLFGSDGATVGDVNDDGVDDIVIGVPGDNAGSTSNSGAVYVLFMREDGRVNTFQKISNGTGDLNTFYTLLSNNQFGNGVGPAGDFNNDGVEDILVSAIGDSANQGALYLLYLGTDGKVDNAIKLNVSGLASTDLFGIDVDTIGDLDDDGVVDFVVGAHGNDDGGTAGTSSNRGAVYIVFMNSDGSVKANQRISDTQGGFTDTLSNNDLFGISVDGIGDFDGDGVEDIAVGSNRGGVGAAYIIYLNTNGTVKSYVKYSNSMHNFPYTLKAGQIFGQSVQMVPDIDGNGVRELMIGNQGYNTYGVLRGGIWIAFLDSAANVIDAAILTDSSGKLYTNMHAAYVFGVCTRYYGLDSAGNLRFFSGIRDDGANNTDRGGFLLMSLSRNPLVQLKQHYAELKRKPDGGVYLASHNRVKFIYDEEYEVGTTRKLQYKLYKDTHELVAEVDASGSAAIVGSPLLPVAYGRNKILANFSAIGLSAGYYLLEVITSKNEKRYLKFKI